MKNKKIIITISVVVLIAIIATVCFFVFTKDENPTEETPTLNPLGTTTTTPSVSTSGKKSNEEIADEVILGLWGVNPERKQKLIAAGYDYDAIQAIVNQKMAK